MSAGCLLLLHLGAATPLAPALAAALAATDPSHHVVIRQSARGFQVVLRHDCPGTPAHRHGLVARALTVFAQRTTAAQPDHVILFAAAGTPTTTAAFLAEPAAESPLLEAFPAGQTLRLSHSAHAVRPVFPRPPPAVSGLLLTVRSTVLLV